MSKHPVKLAKRALCEVENEAVGVLEPAPGANRFVSFRYSYTEMSVQGGKTHVRSRHARLEDGKLTSEAFEGEVDQDVYDRSIKNAQQYFADQTAFLLKSLSLFLPFSRKHRSDRD